MFLNPDEIVGERYRIVKPLGKGGFGTTYLAEDIKHRNRNNLADTATFYVAVKQVKLSQTDGHEANRDFNYLEKLEREANTLKNLEHPCIPQLFNSFYENDYYYIVQEYIQGLDLTHEILPGTKFSEQEATNMLQELLEIVEFIHQNNIIHRDIKPANIVRRQSNNQLVLIDFGAVKEIATEHIDATGQQLTRVIYAKGYTPPEQSSGNLLYNSDIYALGITLMQAVTGFSIDAIYDIHKLPIWDNEGNYQWSEHAPHLSEEFKAIISQMIRYHFKNRYQSVSEVLKDLGEFQIGKFCPIFLPEQESQVLERKKLVPPPNSRLKIPQKTKFLIITIVSFLASIIISIWLTPLINDFIVHQDACSLELNDRLSCGEEILDPFTRNALRAKGAEKYQQKKYLDAFQDFHESWQNSHDAETLIYLNNALLDANKIKTKTISVAVPFTSDKTKEIKTSVISQEFLKGVAQAQTEVNLSLSKSNFAIAKGLEEYQFLPFRVINTDEPQGLKVIIADDANQQQQAKKVAAKLAENKRNLGLIGHYNSKITADTIDIYNRKNLPQISYGTTITELSQEPRNNFFRVVYTTNEEAEALVNYIGQYDLEEKKIAIFYNPSSDYSYDFKKLIQQKIKNLNNPNINILETFDLGDEQNFSASLAMEKLNDERGINICLLLPDDQINNSLARAIEIIQVDNGQRLMLGGDPLMNPQVTKLQTEQPLNLVVSTFWHPTADQGNQFNQQTQKLWGEYVSGSTAMAYDATRTMIEAIKQQQKPSREGTIEKLKYDDFIVKKVVTGEVLFNTPKNGDRLNFYPTLVCLHRCASGNNRFIAISVVDYEASNLVCQ